MPSGALTKLTGRNQLSDERTNSVVAVERSVALNVGPSGVEQHPMDQVVLRVADEGVAVERLGVGGAAVDRDARRRRRRRGGWRRADSAERSPWAIRRLERICRQRSSGLIRKIGTGPPAMFAIAAARAGTGSAPGFERQHGVEQRLRLVAEEAVAPVVERVAELDRAGDRLECARSTGSKRKSACSTRDRSGVRVVGAADLAAVARRRAVDLVVEPPRQVVDASPAGSACRTR